MCSCDYVVFVDELLVGLFVVYVMFYYGVEFDVFVVEFGCCMELIDLMVYVYMCGFGLFMDVVVVVVVM